jgi:hypothetical protein
MISSSFERLPTCLQREIYKLATYNPFRKTKLIERFTPMYGVCEIRETATFPDGTYYKIQAFWKTDINGNNATLNHIYVHRYNACTIECVMTYNTNKGKGRELEIREPMLSKYIHDLVDVYRSRTT